MENFFLFLKWIHLIFRTQSEKQNGSVCGYQCLFMPWSLFVTVLWLLQFSLTQDSALSESLIGERASSPPLALPPWFQDIRILVQLIRLSSCVWDTTPTLLGQIQQWNYRLAPVTEPHTVNQCLGWPWMCPSIRILLPVWEAHQTTPAHSGLQTCLTTPGESIFDLSALP